MLFSTILLSVSLLPLLTSGAPIRARHGDGDDDDVPTVPSVPSTNNEDPKVIQGLNFLFSSFSAETSCNKGQVACVKGGTATCAEDNDVFELTPCSNGLTCLASPGLINGSIPIGCTTEAAVNQALTTLGVTDGVSKDNGVTTLPANIIIVSTGNDGTFPTESAPVTLPTATATATATGTETAAPEPTCVPDEDGDDEGDDDEGEIPSTVPTFEATLGDPVPTGTVVASTTANLPVDPTCTEEPEDPEATETGTVGGTEPIPTASVSTLTLILVPNPTNPTEFITSTFSPSTSTSTVTVTASSSTGTVVSIETSSIPSTSTVIPGPTITPSGPLVNPIGTGQIPAVPDVNTIGVGEIPVKRSVKRQQAPIGSPAGGAIPPSNEVISAQDAQGRNTFLHINNFSVPNGSACGAEGAVQCVDGASSIARCVEGHWTIEQSCSDSTECWWVPSNDGSIAPAVTCSTRDNVAVTFGALSLGIFAPGS